MPRVSIDSTKKLKPPRLRDVADVAGVSIALVSSFINRPEQVGSKSAVKISNAIEQLGFVPNDAARQLRRGVSRMIAFVAFDVGDPFFALVARGAQRRAAEAGLSLVLADTDGRRSTEAEYLALFRQQRVRGILLAPVDDPRTYFTETGSTITPTVFIDQPAPSETYGSVAINDVLGGELAAAHLLSLGRRRLAFVGGPTTIRQVADRLTGVRSALAHVRDASLEIFHTEERNALEGRSIAEAVLRRGVERRPDGIFCVNDTIAAGVLQVLLRDPSIRVPYDIAVIGYNDVAADVSSLIPLSSIRQPHEAFGSTAVDLLMEEFAAVDKSPRRHVVFDPELIVRESTSGK